MQHLVIMSTKYPSVSHPFKNRLGVRGGRTPLDLSLNFLILYATHALLDLPIVAVETLEATLDLQCNVDSGDYQSTVA